MTVESIAVLGLGSVGALAARLLDGAGFDVCGFDHRQVDADVPTSVADVSDRAELVAALGDRDAVLSCLPYQLNRQVAEVATETSTHYFDLTEDVSTTAHIRALAAGADIVMIPQCGLAPGFVGIVAASLVERFDHCRSVRMRVGALPQHPQGLLGYAFNWSPDGVVNEYLNDSEVIEDGVRKTVSSMEWLETIYVNGTQLEAFTTSGGLGTMTETYLGRVDNLDYKSIRYPGHMKLMNFYFHELLLRERRALAGEVLTHAKPPVDDDVVYVHIAAEGTAGGQLRRHEFVREYRPLRLRGFHETAIAWTTACSAVAVVELVRDATIAQRGFVKQETIPLSDFLATSTGSQFSQPG